MNELIIILSSTWKFAATFPVAVYLFRMSFIETIIYTNCGGFLGIIASALSSKGLLKLVNYLWPKSISIHKKSRKIFSRRNRLLVVLKRKYGLPGIIILTPVLLSIPVGTFLLTKYYGENKKNYVYLILGQVAWSFIYTILYMNIKSLF